MRKVWLIAALFPLLVVAAKAQQEVGMAPIAEWNASYSFARLGENGAFDSTPLNWGWNTAVVGNVNRWLGLVGDFSGHYGKSSLIGTDAEAGTNVHTLLFGPRIYYRERANIAPYVQALFGTARFHRDINTFIPEEGVIPAVGTIAPVEGGFISSLDDTGWGFGMKLGGGLDVRVYQNLWYRPFDVNYLLTRRGGNSLHNIELSSGLMFHLGGTR